MKHKFDFVLDNNKYDRTVFRFYLNDTRVHGFGDEPPKSWDEVYKAYYSWAIMRQYYDECHNVIPEDTRILFDMGWDEDSAIPCLARNITYSLDEKKDTFAHALGQPAANWEISYCEYEDIVTGKTVEYLKFVLWNTDTDQGFNFCLKKDSALEFVEYINKINDYALAHSEGI